MGIKESNIVPNAGRAEIEEILKTVMSYSHNSFVHAVYSEPDDGSNWAKGQMTIEQSSKKKDNLKFSAMWYEDPFGLDLEKRYRPPMRNQPKTFTGISEKTPWVLEKYSPRRIIIDDPIVLTKVDKYIGNPYTFIGFEIGLRDLGLRIFATTRDKKAGLKLYQQRQPVEVGHLANVLNEIVNPKIEV